MVKNMSGGNQQKVVIGKWLTRETDILIFDEPTRGIDVGAKDEVYKLLNELAKQGKSIIMISSELPEILRMSDRIMVMCEGRLTGILKNKEADQNLIMQYATKYRKGRDNGQTRKQLNNGKYSPPCRAITCFCKPCGNLCLLYLC